MMEFTFYPHCPYREWKGKPGDTAAYCTLRSRWIVREHCIDCPDIPDERKD